MQKKAIISVLSVVMAMLILSLTLVFTLGPGVSAAYRYDEKEYDDDNRYFVTLDRQADFNIDENGVLCGLSRSGYEKVRNAEEISVVIPDGVIEINWGIVWSDIPYESDYGDYYYKVTSVSLPDGLEIIGDYAFCNCFNLRDIVIPASVTEIGTRAFQGCSIDKVYLPVAVETMGEDVFSEYPSKIYCEATTRPAGWPANFDGSNVMPKSVTDNDYNHEVYWGCKLVNDILYQIDGDGLTYSVIGYMDWIGEANIVAEIDSKLVTRIEDNVFEHHVLSRVTIPSSVEYIGAFAFCGVDCDIYIPASVTEVNRGAFWYIRTTYVAAGVDQSDWSVEWHYDRMTEVCDVKVDTDSPYYDKENEIYGCGINDDVVYKLINNGTEYSVVGYVGNADHMNVLAEFNGKPVTAIADGAFYQCGFTSINLPSSIEAIGEYAFYCSNIRYVLIPDVVTEIKEGTFAYSNLEKITMPDTIQTIEQFAFYECYNLNNVVIPNGVTTINYKAFCHDSGLRVYIPSSVTKIERYAFGYCKVTYCGEMKGVDWHDEWRYERVDDCIEEVPSNWVNRSYVTNKYYCVTDGKFVYHLINGDTAYEIVGYLGEDDEVVVPAEYNHLPVTTIGHDAFYDCLFFTIKLTNNITTIEGSAFYDCQNLELLVIPDTVTRIDEAIFYGCVRDNAYSWMTVYCEPAERPVGWSRYWDWNDQWTESGDDWTDTDAIEVIWDYHVPEYTVSFDAIGVDDQIVEEGNKATKPIPTLTGYGFQYWYVDDENVEFDFDEPIVDDIVLHAKWEINKYTVTFDAENGTQVTNVVVEYNNAIAAPVNPVREGYTFKGWYTDVMYQNQYDFDSEVTSNVDLYAKWLLNRYTITFDSQEGSVVDAQIVDHGKKVVEPTAPVREGYTFQGWFDGEDKYNFNTAVAEDKTLTAQWEIIPAEIKNDSVNAGVVAGVAGGSAVGLSSIATISVVLIRRRRK